jgi:hypothetical protein
LQEDYFRALRDLAEAGAAEVLKAKNSEDIRAITCYSCGRSYTRKVSYQLFR